MVLDAESVIERRRLKRRVTIWRIAAVVLGLLFLGAFFFGDRQMGGSAGILPHVARINVSGVITDDRKLQAFATFDTAQYECRKFAAEFHSTGRNCTASAIT